MRKKNIILIAFLICSYNVVLCQYINTEKKLIIGNWRGEEGSWKLIFTSTMKCYEYFDNKLSDTYKYKISNTSPQCGAGADANKNKETSYLELTNLKDDTNTCYVINGVTAKILSLTGWRNAYPSVFVRQINSVIQNKKSKHY